MAYTLLAIAVLVLALVPAGTAAFILGFVYGESPCVLCWEQRIGMILIALLGLFVLRFGARPKYVGVAVLVGAWGMFAGLRQLGLHAARDIGQGFAAEIAGAHTYTWSLFIFWVCVIMLGILLALLNREGFAGASAPMRPLRHIDKLAFAVFLVVVAGNIIQAFASTGPPPFVGQSDPVRFSFNPRHWVWSLEEWSPAPISLRGRWSVEKPDVSSLPVDPAAGPLVNPTTLRAARQVHLAFPLKGVPTGLAYDAPTDRFAISTDHGVYLLNGGLSQVLRYTIVDPGYSVDLARFADIAFLDSSTLVVLSENKSYVVLRENDAADAAKNFRFFLESFDKFDEVSRSRFATVRGRMMYTRSLAYDSGSSSLYSISVPNSRTHRLVVSRFSRADMTLAEEFVPALDAGSSLTLAGEKRSLDEYYVTAATFADESLLALSAAYRTLLVFSPDGHTLDAAYALPGVNRPAGMAVKGHELFVLGEDATVTLYELRN
jgi:disulfide bond formation protein DsbB